MIKLVTPGEMNAILAEMEKGGLSEGQIIEDAARAIVRIIEAEYGYLAESGALGLIGSGLKGRIALATLAMMAQGNWTVTAYTLSQPSGKDPWLDKLSGLGCNVITHPGEVDFKQLSQVLNQHSLWLDGMAEGDVEDDKIATAILQHLERLRPSFTMPSFVVAVDGPSGVDLTSGKVARHTLPADKTVGIAALKTGLMCPQALAIAGELRLAEVGGIDTSASYRAVQRVVVDSDFTRVSLDQTQKESLSNVCILGGSVNLPGRILLSGQAALRSGIHQVTLAAAMPLYETIAGHIPEAAWLILPHEMGVITPAAVALLQKESHTYTSLLIGAGIGSENTTRDFLGRLLDIPASATRQKIGFVRSLPEDGAAKTHAVLPPLIVDQDGLGLLSQLPDWQARLPKDTILILDSKIFSQISGIDIDTLKTKWMTILEECAKTWNATLVYLGFPIAVVSPEDGTAVISGDAIDFDKAGMGSLLAGIVAALRGQGMGVFQSAASGAWLFRQAASAGIEQVGSPSAFLASDAAACLADIMLFVR